MLPGYRQNFKLRDCSTAIVKLETDLEQNLQIQRAMPAPICYIEKVRSSVQ